MVAWPQSLVDLVFMALSALGMVALWAGLRRDRGLVLGLMVLAGLVVVQLSAFPAWRAARQGENWRDVAVMLSEGMREGMRCICRPRR